MDCSEGIDEWFEVKAFLNAGQLHHIVQTIKSNLVLIDHYQPTFRIWMGK